MYPVLVRLFFRATKISFFLPTIPLSSIFATFVRRVRAEEEKLASFHWTTVYNYLPTGNLMERQGSSSLTVVLIYLCQLMLDGISWLQQELYSSGFVCATLSKCTVRWDIFVLCIQQYQDCKTISQYKAPALPPDGISFPALLRRIIQPLTPSVHLSVQALLCNNQYWER